MGSSEDEQNDDGQISEEDEMQLTQPCLQTQTIPLATSTQKSDETEVIDLVSGSVEDGVFDTAYDTRNKITLTLSTGQIQVNDFLDKVVGPAPVPASTASASSPTSAIQNKWRPVPAAVPESPSYAEEKMRQVVERLTAVETLLVNYRDYATRVERTGARVTAVETRVTNIEAGVSPDDPDRPASLHDSLPIKSYCDFIALGETLRVNDRFRRQLENLVAEIPLDTGCAGTSVVLNAIITNNLAMQMSLEGRTKHKFNLLGVGTLVLSLLDRFFTAPNEKKTPRSQVQDWLKHAASRSIRRFFRDHGIAVPRYEKAREAMTFTGEQYDAWRDYSDYPPCCSSHRQRVRYTLIAGKLKPKALDDQGRIVRTAATVGAVDAELADVTLNADGE